MTWEDEFKNYLKKLDKEKPVIICGDLNVAHTEIDLKNPKTNRHNAGFTDEEREKMTKLLDILMFQTVLKKMNLTIYMLFQNIEEKVLEENY